MEAIHMAGKWRQLNAYRLTSSRRTRLYFPTQFENIKKPAVCLPVLFLWENSKFCISSGHFVDRDHISCRSHIGNAGVLFPAVHHFACGCYHSFLQSTV